MRPSRLSALVLAVAALSACGALSPEKPEVTILSVHLDAGGLRGISGRMEMNVFNPNGFGLPLSKVDWNLRVGTANAVHGSFDLAETIPAKASAPVTGSFHIGTLEAVAVAQQIAMGARDYTLQGRFYFQGKLGELYVDVSHAGRVD